jgi:hypothetical protein
MKFSLHLLITVVVTIIVSVVISFGISRSVAQTSGPRESRFIGTLVTSTGTRFLRLEDSEYSIVCYTGGSVFTCVKK